MSIVQQQQYMDAAQRLLQESLGQPESVRRALQRLSADYMRRVVLSLSPANDDAMAGDVRSASGPRAN